MVWTMRILAVVAALMLLFPPFHGELGMGAAVNRGYHFILMPPTISDQHTAAFATVNVPILLVQYLALAFIALVMWLSRRKKD